MIQIELYLLRPEICVEDTFDLSQDAFSSILISNWNNLEFLLFQLFAILLAHSLMKEIMIARKEFCEKSELRIDLHKVYDSTSPLGQSQ